MPFARRQPCITGAARFSKTSARDSKALKIDNRGEAGLPPEFAALPADRMVVGSAQYTREALYGLAELNESVHAAYTDDAGSEYQAFVLLQTDEITADDTWQNLASRWQEIDLDGEPVLFREVPYSGLVGVIRSNGKIIGVADSADDEQLLDRLGRIAAR